MRRAAGLVVLCGAVTLGAFTPGARAEGSIATLRGATELTKQPDAPPMAKVVDRNLRRARSYPEQPPTIPHTIRDYQIDLNVNKCLTCHARKHTEESQAPMISITHFMDRDGQVLATVSPRRYFCNQCHVVEHDAKPLVGNDFVDVDTLLSGQ